MSRLLNPVRYEPAADGFNTGKSLILSDIVKRDIVLPVGDINPPDAGRPIEGRLLRSDRRGNLLIDSLPEPCENYEDKSVLGLIGAGIHTIDFSQVVRYVFLTYTVLAVQWFVKRNVPVSGIVLDEYEKDTGYFIPIRCTTALFSVNIVAGTMDLIIYGFY